MGIISRAMLHSWEEMGCLDDNNSEELKTENIKLKKDIEQLKVENEQLKQQLAEIGKSWGEIQRMREEKENLIEQLVIYNQFENSYNKYHQTLQEIKAIADARCNECKYGKDGISCKYGDCGEAKLHLITQLITKAESEEE